MNIIRDKESKLRGRLKVGAIALTFMIINLTGVMVLVALILFMIKWILL